MTVQDLIDKLQEVEDKTLPVCVVESHEYWGEVYNEIDYACIEKSAQPDGPKRASRPAIVLRC